MTVALRTGRFALAMARPQASTSALAMRSSAFHTSRAARASDAGAHADADHGPFTASDYSSPIWTRSILALVAGVGLVKLNNTFGIDEDSDDKRPWLTRYLDYNKPDSKKWQAHEEKHMEFARERAATKLFLQDAEHPPIIRMRRGALSSHDGPMARQVVGA